MGDLFSIPFLLVGDFLLYHMSYHMRITGIVLLLSILSGCATQTQPQNKQQLYRKHILFLSSPALSGRAPATLGERKAAEYIANQFSNYTCKVQLQPFYFQGDTAINVLGMLNAGKDSTIIISAHYDHIGIGTDKSREIHRKGIHPGADDNASGVALMIELADSLKHYLQKDSLQYNYLFAAWSAHEAGLFGSSFFTQSPTFDSLKIRAVINLDMVGRLNRVSPILRISGALTNQRIANIFSTIHNGNVTFRYDDENILKSDLLHFAHKQITVVGITTGIHDDYHRISDTEDKINYEGMSIIQQIILSALRKI